VARYFGEDVRDYIPLHNLISNPIVTLSNLSTTVTIPLKSPSYIFNQLTVFFTAFQESAVQFKNVNVK
jgi:hypothetical protein